MAIFLKGGKAARLRMTRMRQARWDKSHYASLSTRVPVRTARRFVAECQRNGQTVYAALRAYVETVAQKSQTTTAPPGTGGGSQTSSDQ